MQCGIIGLTGGGKTTLFQALTAHTVPVQRGMPSPNIGLAEIPDSRLHEIAEHVPTRRIVPARIHLVDIPGISHKTNSDHSTIFAHIRGVDALCHVVACFGNTDSPTSAYTHFRLEMLFADLALIEGAYEKACKAAKTGERESMLRRDTAAKAMALLGDGRFVREGDWTTEERNVLRGYGLLTEKAELVLANIGESNHGENSKSLEELRTTVAENDCTMLTLCTQLESEIAELATNDRDELLKSMGLSEPAIGTLARTLNDLLGLTTFYTAGEKEVRSWIIRRGAKAPDAAAAVHSDIARGFIRAECYHIDDLRALKSEKAIKLAGKLRSEGKQYSIQDGDIVHFLFNV